MLRIGVIMYQTSLSKGQELVAQRMTRELIAQGHEAILITSRFHDSQPIFTSEELDSNGGYVRYEDKELGIPVVRVDSHKVDWPPRRINFKNFTAITHRLVEEFNLNVLITHSTLWNGPDLAAQFVAWQRQLKAHESTAKKLLFCHMSHFQTPAEERYSLRERTYREVWNEYSLARIIREADLLLVVSPVIEQEMLRLGAKKDQCMLFPGGINLPQIKSEKELEAFRASYGVPSDVKIVTFLGTIEERKNVSSIVDIAKLIQDRSDIKFVIAGKPEGHYGTQVSLRAADLQNLQFIGEISEDTKSALIGTSYLNLILSRLEALGLAQLEFMSAGVPVVTSGVGGQSWIIKNGKTGIILKGPNDIAGAASAIMKLVADPTYRDQLGRDAKKFAHKFLMKELVKKLVQKLKSKLEPTELLG